jgi:hypothetical protein
LAKLNLNLPLTPIRDLQIHKGKGFSRCYMDVFWVLDDITPLYEIKDKTIKADKHLLNHVLLIECKADKAMT